MQAWLNKRRCRYDMLPARYGMGMPMCLMTLPKGDMRFSA